MLRNSIPIYKHLKQEIEKSHARSREYGIDPNTIVDKNHVRLSEDALALLLQNNSLLVQVATASLQKLYDLFQGAGFCMVLVHRDGYVMKTFGDSDTLKKWEAVNLAPGYRWTEKDVGTGSIALCLHLHAPVQVHDEEHYCMRSYDRTGSASPVYDADDNFIAVISLTGDASKIHLHTLGMIITAAEGITKQLKLIKSAKELQLSISYLNTTIEAIDSAILVVDEQGLITRINDIGRNLLRCSNQDIIGKKIQPMLGIYSNWKEKLIGEYIDREVFFKGPNETVQVFLTSKPIGESGEGFVVRFNESSRVRKLVNKIAGFAARFTMDDILGTSTIILGAKKLALTAASSKSNVLLLGETGTGKELFAQAIHNQSRRKNKPFIAINCGAIPRELIESELFGYAEGAFTGAQKGGHPGKFELANGGTIFLDEIGDMPTDMQVKLLRVLQSGEVIRIGSEKSILVDVRIITATNVDLKKQVERKVFREDLFYRLNVVPIVLPTLRERPEDILLLARHFLNRCCELLGKKSVAFSQDAEEALTNYHWPGNIRELGNIVERAVNLVEGTTITAVDLSLSPLVRKKTVVTTSKNVLEAVEQQAILEIMVSVGNNISSAAKMLGLTRATLYQKLKKYNL